jgi:hypothetical protein
MVGASCSNNMEGLTTNGRNTRGYDKGLFSSTCRHAQRDRQ